MKIRLLKTEKKKITNRNQIFIKKGIKRREKNSELYLDKQKT